MIRESNSSPIINPDYHYHPGIIDRRKISAMFKGYDAIVQGGKVYGKKFLYERVTRCFGYALLKCFNINAGTPYQDVYSDVPSNLLDILGIKYETGITFQDEKETIYNFCGKNCGSHTAIKMLSIEVTNRETFLEGVTAKLGFLCCKYCCAEKLPKAFCSSLMRYLFDNYAMADDWNKFKSFFTSAGTCLSSASSKNNTTSYMMEGFTIDFMSKGCKLQQILQTPLADRQQTNIDVFIKDVELIKPNKKEMLRKTIMRIKHSAGTEIDDREIATFIYNHCVSN